MASILLVAATDVPVVPNLYLVGLLAFPVVGGLVVRQRPGNVVGRLLVLTAASLGLGGLSTVATWLALGGQAGAWRDLAAWVGTWAYMPVTILLPILIAVFPTGRISSTWLRRALCLGAAGVGLTTILYAVAPLPVNEIFFGDAPVNPWAFEGLASVGTTWDEVSTYLVLALFVGAVVDLGWRLRRERGVERLQMRLAGFGLSVCAALFAGAVAAELVGLGSQGLWVATFGLGFAALPISVGVAAARFRLYDIDRLISRTVSYSLVLGILAGAYVGGVLLVGLVLPLQDEVAVAVATLVAAASFRPLRDRLRAVVDRRFNRAHYDTARIVDAFGASLRDEVELAALERELLAVIERTLQPAVVSLWTAEHPRARQAFRR